ncbi:hypothetical protein Dimus_037644, partial [Dionaea muscipula]
QGLPAVWWSLPEVLRWEAGSSDLSSSAKLIYGEPADSSLQRNCEFWVRTVAERVVKEGSGLLMEESQPALTDSLEGRGSTSVPPPDLDLSQKPDGHPLRLDLGSFLVGSGCLRIDLVLPPRCGVELLAVNVRQVVPATNLPEGEASIIVPDSLLGVDLTAPGSLDDESATDGISKLPVEPVIEADGLP